MHEAISVGAILRTMQISRMRENSCSISVKIRALCENSRTVLKFAHCANFSACAKLLYFPFCFAHNFLIRTLFWVILVSLESLESVESKYI